MVDTPSRHTWSTWRLKALAVSISIAMLLVNATVVPWVSRFSSRLALLLAGLPFVALFLSEIETGIVVLLPVASLVDFEIGTGSQSAINAAMLFTALLLGLWLARMVIVEKQIRLVPSNANTPLVGLLFSACFSFVVGFSLQDSRVPTPSNLLSVQAGALSLFILSAGAFWLVANSVRDMKWLKVLVLVHAVLGAAALGNIFLGLPYIFKGVSGLYAMWAVALAYGQLLYNHKLRGWQRLLLVLMIGAWLYWAWFFGSSWVSGWGPSVIALLVITALRSRQMLLVAIVSLILVVAFQYDYFYDKVWLTAEKTGSFRRFGLWQMAIKVGMLQPIWGLGPGNYLRYAQALFSGGPEKVTVSHNNYVDIFAQTGMIGLIFFVWFMLAVGQLAWRLRKRFRAGFAGGYVHSALGAWVAIMVAMWLGDWFLPYVYNIGLSGFRHTVGSWLLLGGLISLSQIGSEATQGV